MALTSEKQKEYSVNKGGYSYYTLYRGVYDPTNGIDERPSYAETGDRFEPVDSDKVYVCTRRKGKATWAEDPNAQRQTETGDGEGGGVSSWNDLTDKPFYEETTPGIDLTLDISEATDGVEASLVTTATGLQPLTRQITMYRVGDAITAAQMNGATGELVQVSGGSSETSELTVDGGDAVIVNGTGFASFASPLAEGVSLPYVFSIEESSAESRSFVLGSDENTACELQGVFVAGTYFLYFATDSDSFSYVDDFSKDAVTTVHKLDSKFYDKTQLPTGTNTGDLMTWGGSTWGAVPNPYAPLIVNIAPNQAGTALVGDKTYNEILAASLSGKIVVFFRGEQGATLAVDCGVSEESPGSVYVVIIFAGSPVIIAGASDQYPELAT